MSLSLYSVVFYPTVTVSPMTPYSFRETGDRRFDSLHVRLTRNNYTLLCYMRHVTRDGTQYVSLPTSVGRIVRIHTLF